MHENFQIEETEQDETIDLQVFLGDMWRGLVKFWWVILCLALLFGGIQFYRTFIRYQPIYTCSATYTVHTENAAIISDSGLSTYTFSYNASTAEQLTNVFSYAVNSPMLCKRVSADLGLSTMPVSVSALCVADANLLTITVRGPDPNITYDALASVVEHYSSVTDYIIGRTRLAVISEPVYPETPSNSRDWIKSVALGVLLGIGIGLLLITAYALIRRTVRTKEDIRTKLNTTCLGTLPQVTFKKYRSEINTDILLSNLRIGNDFLESMRLLRSAVKTGLGETGRSVLITSTAPGEGKSVVTVNLAAMLAKQEARVLVIDADLRNSGIRVLMENIRLMPSVKREEYVIETAESLGIDILHFDHKKIQPQHILRDCYIRRLLDSLYAAYDYILIDTQPCGVVSDASSVARVADGVIYVVRQDAVMLDSIRAGLNSILQVDAKLLGCVLNGATGGYGGYGSYYSYRGYYRYYRYGYSYADGYGKKKRRKGGKGI